MITFFRLAVYASAVLLILAGHVVAGVALSLTFTVTYWALQRGHT